MKTLFTSWCWCWCLIYCLPEQVDEQPSWWWSQTPWRSLGDVIVIKDTCDNAKNFTCFVPMHPLINTSPCRDCGCLATVLLVSKLAHFFQNSLDSKWKLGMQLTKIIIGTNNDMQLNRYQAITSTNDDLVHRCVHAPTGLKRSSFRSQDVFDLQPI